MEKKKKFRLNIIDWAIIVIVVACAAFGGYKYLSSPATVDPPKTYKYTVVFDNYETSEEAIANDKIKIGDKMIDKSSNAVLGTVKSYEVGKSRVYTTTSEGKVVATEKPNFVSLTVTLEGSGQFMANGGLLINGTGFYCNKSYEVFIGDATYWLRMLQIDRANDENN